MLDLLATVVYLIENNVNTVPTNTWTLGSQRPILEKKCQSIAPTAMLEQFIYTVLQDKDGNHFPFLF